MKERLEMVGLVILAAILWFAVIFVGYGGLAIISAVFADKVTALTKGGDFTFYPSFFTMFFFLLFFFFEIIPTTMRWIKNRKTTSFLETWRLYREEAVRDSAE